MDIDIIWLFGNEVIWNHISPVTWFEWYCSHHRLNLIFFMVFYSYCFSNENEFVCNNTFHYLFVKIIIWPKYCRYVVKHYIMNQTINKISFTLNTRPLSYQISRFFIKISNISKKEVCRNIFSFRPFGIPNLQILNYIHLRSRISLTVFWFLCILHFSFFIMFNRW